jgi:hypothetical protein
MSLFFFLLLTRSILGSERAFQHTVYSLYPFLAFLITSGGEIVGAFRCAEGKGKTLILGSGCNANSDIVPIHYVAQKYLSFWMSIL